MAQAQQIYDIGLTTLTGRETTLGEYKGKVLLIVNTASKCGFTKQYADLQKLYEQYKDAGLVILGFPANNFMKQEPGTNEEIQEFCRINYGVSFPMMAKISVKGADIHPLYRYLTDKDTNPEFGGKISWNFNKFLIGREGDIIGRFASKTNPMDSKVVNAIEKALQ